MAVPLPLTPSQRDTPGALHVPRKKTIRKLPPLTRDYARLYGELASITRRYKNRLAKLEALENELLHSQAEARALQSILDIQNPPPQNP